jgi:hypothetical protein
MNSFDYQIPNISSGYRRFQIVVGTFFVGNVILVLRVVVAYVRSYKILSSETLLFSGPVSGGRLHRDSWRFLTVNNFV